ncbi:O-methyltransferase [Penicillium macrosclerotiorum]|uniref:O-methyltransferase n=1 Tax=Penicillium macrosclerotiorum TaxID=303699 RepID=UPI0025469FB1|nr:O-methyltransferase [Penicillium macrosclerotiorum]KAJ5678868.1 O-methyltransferase [Penicillium macrosclerotiorum]
MPSLTELAEHALVLAKRLDAYTASNGLPPTSLERDTLSLAGLSQDLHSIRHDLGDIAQMIKRQVNDPVRNLTEIMFSFTDLSSLNIIYRYNLPSKIPLEPSNKTVSTEEIAKASGIPQNLCRRVLVHAMENGIFVDAGECQVGHSSLSRLLATDPGAFQTVGMLLDELMPATLHIPEALKKYGTSSEPNQTAYNLVNDTSLPIYRFLEERPDRRSRFGTTMGFFSRDQGFNLQHLVNGFSWASIDRPDAVVVDIGGGVGVVCHKLAEATKHMKFIVQDLPIPVKLGREQIPAEAEWRDRVQFSVGDFLEQDQTFIGADVYFLRWILHNWSDEYCVQILQRLAPAMQCHSKVVIYEYLLSEGPEFKWDRKQGRSLDMVMYACWNGSERTLTDFISIFKRADKRYVLDGVSLPTGSSMSIVSFGWRDSQNQLA